MDIIAAFKSAFGLKKLTHSSLSEASEKFNTALSDSEKRRICRSVGLSVIEKLGMPGSSVDSPVTGKTEVSGTAVLGVNHVGPLDVSIEWRTQSGELVPVKCLIDSGGDQINVSKVFSAFESEIALVALTGQKNGIITNAWERSFLSPFIKPLFLRSDSEDTPVAVYNIADGHHLPVLFGWLDALSEKTVASLNGKVMETLEEMSKGTHKKLWMALSAGGPLRYQGKIACYRSLVKEIKEKHRDSVNMLIDFKHVSGPKEAMSVLDLPRETPCDIIKPNLQEFLQIVRAGELAGPDLDEKTVPAPATVKKYAAKLREKYNLEGVLVSMDKNGLILALKDRMISEKGVKIRPASHTAAGDSLKAGLLYALSNGKSYEEAVHAGNLFGASTAAMEGSQTVTPEKLAEITALAREQNVKPVVEEL